MKQIRSLFSRKKYSYLLLFSLFIVSLLSACKDDEPLEIGRNILPDEEILVAADTILAIEIHTVDMEPVYARSLGSSPLGGVIDPLFGTVSADFITDFSFADTGYFNSGIPDNFEAQDLELIIKVNNVYGYDSLIDFNVYELLSDFPEYKYSDFEITPDMWDPSSLSVGSPYFVVDDTIWAADSSYTLNVTLHQKLSDDFRDRLLDENLIENENIYKTDSAFRTHFKGLYLKNGVINDQQGGIIRVDFNTAKLVLSATEADTLDVYFSYVLAYPDSPVYGKSLNMVSYEPGGDAAQVLNDISSPQEFAYIQSIAGPKVRLQIPGLNKLRRELEYSSAVNRAELVIPIDEVKYDLQNFPPPSVLGVRDFLNDTNIIDDMLLTGYFGATLDTANKEYRFEVSNYIHYYLRDSLTYTDETLYLFGGQFVTAPASALNPADHNITYYMLSTFGRVVLNGSNSSNPPYLRIIYSSLPK